MKNYYIKALDIIIAFLFVVIGLLLWFFPEKLSINDINSLVGILFIVCSVIIIRSVELWNK